MNKAQAMIRPSPRSRHAPVAAVVLAVHGLAIWALQSGLPKSPPQIVPAGLISVQLLAAEPTPAPAPQPAPRMPAPKPSPQPEPVVKRQPLPSPQKPLAAVPASEPSPNAPTGAVQATAPAASQPSSAAASASSVQASAGPAAPAAAPAKVELPSSSADYLNNAKPAYPPMSKRLGEEGKVVLRVLIEADGSASKAEIRSSSGYERLDQAALQTVLRWRYVPGKRGGVAEAMWFNIPINFVLE